jgi:uncharacterized membrane protein YphA (DoxX/SURF4 family)
MKIIAWFRALLFTNENDNRSIIFRFWAMAYEYRTDFAMTLLLVYLLVFGGGKWSLEPLFFKPQKK